MLTPRLQEARSGIRNTNPAEYSRRHSIGPIPQRERPRTLGSARGRRQEEQAKEAVLAGPRTDAGSQARAA